MSDTSESGQSQAATLRLMAVVHALFAGGQLFFGAVFANAANLVPVAAGAWALRLQGGAMVASGAVLLSIAFGMVRLRPWAVSVATFYAIATIVWAGASIVANTALRATETFEAPRNLFGLLLVLIVHAVALWYDVTRKETRTLLSP